jgi:hypothetical protein
MAAVTSELAGGSLSVAKVVVADKTIDTKPSATFMSLLLMLQFPFMRLVDLTSSSLQSLQVFKPGIERAIQPQHHVNAFDLRPKGAPV